MTTLPIITASKFDPNRDIQYKEPWVNSKGMKTVGINSAEHQQQLHLSVPLMLTWGVNINEFDPGKISYDMNLQFPRPGEETEESTAFLNALMAMQEKLITDATQNARKWFNQPSLSRELAADRLNNMLYVPRDLATGLPKPDKSPSLRVKLDCWDGVFKAEVYDVKQQPLYPGGTATPVDLISKGSQVACLIKCGGIYFSNGKFGVTWRLVQAVVQPRTTLSGRCHISLDPAEIERLQNSVQAEDEVLPDDLTHIAEDIAADIAQTAAPPQVAPASPVKQKKRVVRRRKQQAAEP